MRAFGYPLRDASIENSTRLSVRKPGSSLRRLIKLRVNNPAPTRSNSDKATCTITNAWRDRICPKPPITLLP